MIAYIPILTKRLARNCYRRNLFESVPEELRAFGPPLTN